MYLVMTGNEYGIDLDQKTIPLITTLAAAESKYQQYLTDNDCAVMYQVLPDKLVLVKMDSNF